MIKVNQYLMGAIFCGVLAGCGSGGGSDASEKGGMAGVGTATLEEIVGIWDFSGEVESDTAPEEFIESYVVISPLGFIDTYDYEPENCYTVQRESIESIGGGLFEITNLEFNFTRQASFDIQDGGLVTYYSGVSTGRVPPAPAEITQEDLDSMLCK